MSRESYDNLPYPAAPHCETHPSNLETIATAFGLAPPSIRNCRVLELGCATGGNIVPMACAWPDATFVGIDYSSRQIEAAQRFADAVDARNLMLWAMSITDITPDFGTFDYIIAHGIYSWVPADVRDKVLDVCRANLSENGVAYISFNALPGWHARLWLRHLMQHQLARSENESPTDTVRRIREIVETVCEAPLMKGSPAEASVRRALAGYDTSDACFTLHDLTEDENHPAYLTEVVAAAEAHGLRYLADAHANSSIVEESASPSIRALLDAAGDDYLRREQTLDFLRNQTFRRALFVRSERAIDRANVHDRVARMLATSLLAPDAPEEKLVTNDPVNFKDMAGNVRITLARPLSKVAITLLRMAFPRPRHVSELLDEAATRLNIRSDDPGRGAALQELLQAWSSRLIELYVTSPPAAVAVSERPDIWRVARHQIASGARDVTNLRHEIVKMDDSVRPLLPLLDGTRTVRQFVDASRAHQLSEAAARSLIENLVVFGLLSR